MINCKKHTACSYHDGHDGDCAARLVAQQPKEETPGKMTAAQIFEQLAVIKQRLESYPMANHEVRCVSDCVMLLIRTFAGERVPELQLAYIGGGTMAPAGEQGHTDRGPGGEIMRGGVEIAPGVVQYAAAPGAATMDVEAGQRQLQQSLGPAQTPTADMSEPVPGSLMAMALEGEDIETAQQQETETKLPPGVAASSASNGQSQQGLPPGIPAAHETKVEITPASES